MRNESRTQYAILGLLFERPRSGYELKQVFETRLSHFWRESPGQIYPSLRTMEAEGLIRSDAAPTGKRSRVLNHITPSGRAALSEWLKHPSKLQSPRNEFLLKLYLSTPQSMPAFLADLRRHFAEVESSIKLFEDFQQVAVAESRSPHESEAWRLCIGLGRRLAEARASWCREVFEAFESEKGIDR